MIRRLRWKFVGITMAFVTVVLAVLLVVVLLTTRNSLYQDSITALQQALTLSPTASVETDESTGLLGTERVQLPYLTVQVYNRNSRAEILGNQFFDTDDRSALVSAINAALSEEENTGTLEISGYSLRWLRESNIWGWRIAFVDRAQETSTLRSLTTNLCLIGVGALAVFFLISLLLARWAVRPVERSWKQQRQFVSDASHELKTPLTVILANLDMLEMQEDNPEGQQRRLGNIRAASGQMRTLVEELLMLARSDNATQQLSLQKCDLAEMTEEEILLFEPIAYEHGKSIEEELTPDIRVNGDAALLRRIADIYLDNACKYAPAGSEISVTLRAEGSRALLGVRSAGAPIPPERLDRLFERFYRDDPSRSEEGYGLGLAIAQELAKLHHGKVWADSDENGNVFYFSMPRIRSGGAGE